MAENAKNMQTKPQGKVYQGEVVSDKMQKTVVVKVTRTFKHPSFEKVVRRAKNYKVHDESNQAKVGDIVEIVECRPLSKTKHMMLSRIVSQ